MIKKLINFFKDEEGATMVEYDLLVALIAVVASLAVAYRPTNSQVAFSSLLYINVGRAIHESSITEILHFQKNAN